MGKASKTMVAIVIGLIVVGFFLSIYITVDETMPANAIVVVTNEDKQFHSIYFDHICVIGKTLQTMTLKEALENGYKPDPHCEDLGYFRGTKRFYFHHLLSKLSVRVNSRWDENGNWLW